MRSITKLSVLFAMLVCGLAFAHADIYNFTIDHCTGGCGTSPYGQVEITNGAAGSVDFTVTLFNNNQFVATGFPGGSSVDPSAAKGAGVFGFNIIGDPTITVTGIQSSSSNAITFLNPGSGQWDGFGNFMYAIGCLACNGGGDAFSGPLKFTVSAAGLTVDSFKQLSSSGSPNVLFVADILSGQTGNTGPVGATTPSVPEPASLMLLGTGLSAFAFRLRRKK